MTSESTIAIGLLLPEMLGNHSDAGNATVLAPAGGLADPRPDPDALRGLHPAGHLRPAAHTRRSAN